MKLISKKLDLIFRTALDKKVTMSINNPKSELTKTEVHTVMDTIVDKDIFSFSGVPLQEKVIARVNTVEEVE
ncbi:MAG: DUF2922 domain-containing protein [Sporomusaceae bacterium]|jgi:hypothetical protein|nr:DUF2922 domain-containing protein [Sporomusaceae bacterium]